MAFAGFYAEVIWYSHLGYSEVFWTEWVARSSLFAVAFILMGVLVWLSLFMAFRTRPLGLEGQLGRRSTVTSRP